MPFPRFAEVGNRNGKSVIFHIGDRSPVILASSELGLMRNCTLIVNKEMGFVGAGFSVPYLGHLPDFYRFILSLCP